MKLNGNRTAELVTKTFVLCWPLPLAPPPQACLSCRQPCVHQLSRRTLHLSRNSVLQVQMLWTCPATAWNGTYPMHRVADGQPLYEADVSTGLECPVPADGGPTIVTVQVRVRGRRRIVGVSTRLSLPP